MCILFFALGQHPDYPLIVAANRDEYHRRPSESMHEWPDHPGIIAGRDLQAGGTWLGINRQGRFAAVTNFREGANTRLDKRSRGELVSHYLLSEADRQHQFEEFLQRHHSDYNPFNLVFGDADDIRAWDHRSTRVRELGTGFHSVSNGPIDEPWPKMSLGVEKITAAISRRDDLDIANLTFMMQDQTQAATELMPHTGVDAELERQLSSIFIRGESYGTRTTTILLFGREQVQIVEQDYLPNGDIATSQQFSIGLLRMPGEGN